MFPKGHFPEFSTQWQEIYESLRKKKKKGGWGGGRRIRAVGLGVTQMRLDIRDCLATF